VPQVPVTSFQYRYELRDCLRIKHKTDPGNIGLLIDKGPVKRK